MRGEGERGGGEEGERGGEMVINLFSLLFFYRIFQQRSEVDAGDPELHVRQPLHPPRRQQSRFR